MPLFWFYYSFKSFFVRIAGEMYRPGHNLLLVSHIMLMDQTFPVFAGYRSATHLI